MKLNTVLKISTLAMAITAASAHAADPDTLKTIGNSDASFAAGATINGGAAFQNIIPAGQTIQIRGQITPDPDDVGLEADILVVAKVGNKFFQHTPEGWTALPLDLNSNTLGITPFATVTLGDPVSYQVDDFAVAIGEDLTGKSNIKLLWGYVPTGKG